MTHIEEHLLEIYARKPEKLDAEIRRSVQAHLNLCTACRSIADFLHEFYAGLAALNDAVSPQVEALVGKLFPVASIIPLHPYRYRPDPVSYGENTLTVLAAMSKHEQRPRFEAVATLASEENQTLVRILRDRESDTFRLYVLADQPEKREHAIVTFPELSASFVTDEKGMVAFQLPEGQIPRSWEKLKALLRLPVAKFCLSTDQLKNAQQEPLILQAASLPDCTITLTLDHSNLAIAVAPHEKSCARLATAVVKQADRQPHLVLLENGKGELSLDLLTEEILIYLYN